MNNPASSNFGHLKVNVDSTSVYFSTNAPIEIRDSSMRLVRHEDNTRKFKLPPGLYQVSAVLEDGRVHKRLVELWEGGYSEVKISVPKEQVTSEKYRQTQKKDLPYYEAPRFTQRIETIDDTVAETVAPELDVQLLDLEGASLVRETRTLWIVNCDHEVSAVPTAKIKIGNKETAISLPTSPQGSPTANTCAVRIDGSPSGVHATAWISPERTVANAFQNMLASGQLLHAARMADDAVELLRDKYSDPTGAVLGALILQKFGRLAKLESWVDNLARDFAWIPDGKILLATLKVSKRTDLDTALQLAIDASKQRMLYTESYSILLDMLRRWPRESDRTIRYDAMADLASHSPFIDWDSICLSRIAEG